MKMEKNSVYDERLRDNGSFDRIIFTESGQLLLTIPI